MVPVPLSVPPSTYAVSGLVALTAHVPQLLSAELKHKTPRPLALCAIGVYGLFCVAVAALGFMFGA